jgi:hypothetical protein
MTSADHARMRMRYCGIESGAGDGSDLCGCFGTKTECFRGISVTSGIGMWRKDLRSIPKVFLIDAYEVS